MLPFREMGVRGVAYYDHGCLFLKGTRRIVRGVPDAACEANVEAAFAALEADKTSPVIYKGEWMRPTRRADEPKAPGMSR